MGAGGGHGLPIAWGRTGYSWGVNGAISAISYLISSLLWPRALSWSPSHYWPGDHEAKPSTVL